MIKNWLYRGTSLDECIAGVQNNNFTLIRLAAALLVVETHAHFFTEKNEAPFFTQNFDPRLLGLPTFFFLSGLLVTQSLYTSSSWRNFIWKRMLRLYPAACFSILFCALVIGPAFTVLTLRDYFTSPVLYQFLNSCSLIRLHFMLPGVFDHSIMGTSAVNAPLWSISLELKLYAGLLLAWLLKVPGKKQLLLGLIICLVAIGVFYSAGAEQWLAAVSGHQFNIFIYTTYAPLFMIGSLCCLYRKKIVIRNHWSLLITAALLFSLYFDCYNLTGFILLPAFVLFIGAKGTRILKTITPRADLSYGMYVFAFPLQQIIANYLHPADPLAMFAWSVLAVLPFAIFSWFMVEKKALGWKHLVK